MAPPPKELINTQHKLKSTSSSTRMHKRSRTVIDPHLGDKNSDETTSDEKPIPNYRRHTVNSCNYTNCKYPKEKPILPLQQGATLRNSASKNNSSKLPNKRANSASRLLLPSERVAATAITITEERTNTRTSKSSKTVVEKTNRVQKVGTKRINHSEEIARVLETDHQTLKKLSPKNSTKSSPAKKFDNAKELKVDSSPDKLRRLWQDQTGDQRILKFKKSQERGLGEKNGSKHLENVVLKRQQVNARKEAASAYNDVIEETANRILFTKRSKVRALAGAFETVIKLESRPQLQAEVLKTTTIASKDEQKDSEIHDCTKPDAESHECSNENDECEPIFGDEMTEIVEEGEGLTTQLDIVDKVALSEEEMYQVQEQEVLMMSN